MEHVCFSNAVCFNCGCYQKEDIINDIRSYLANKNISIQHIESSNEKIIVFFETFNQHEIINIIKYIKKIYPVLNCLILYFCPKGLFGFDVGAICYSESKNVIIGKYFEHYAKETYELSADIQRVSLEEVGYTYKSYQKDDVEIVVVDKAETEAPVEKAGAEVIIDVESVEETDEPSKEENKPVDMKPKTEAMIDDNKNQKPKDKKHKNEPKPKQIDNQQVSSIPQ